ncbi:MAG TPA: hypothetical protein PLZ93_04425 [Nocardioides sp.]|uniref:hypothetical protein n=1 Tax=uncultured Nocardioides sp. TaxID=198441 RepID=UPI002639BF62|nr:hypothetical protein [uncultured Nocardioides sp.]HRI94834.1 hypothetical protein [Nocardioides sp.]HRK44905.1 hypothetical protein [Nocardioides sp.]
MATLPTRCDIEVRERDLPLVLALIRAQGLSMALGDAPPPDGHRQVAVWSARNELETCNQSQEDGSLVETLARTLEDHAITYVLVNTETFPASRRWWAVRLSDTGMPTGMRVLAGDADELDVQLEALSQFLCVDRAALTATAVG